MEKESGAGKAERIGNKIIGIENVVKAFAPVLIGGLIIAYTVNNYLKWEKSLTGIVNIRVPRLLYKLYDVVSFEVGIGDTTWFWCHSGDLRYLEAARFA